MNFAQPIVNSFNEWDPLEEVIVGIVDGSTVPQWHVVLEATMPRKYWGFFRQNGGKLFPEDQIAAAKRDLDEFCRLLESEGVTAEEKFKHLSDGTVRRYVYYHCSKGKRLPCDEPYIREEDLLTQLLQLINDIEIDEMCVHEQLTSELERYQKFMNGVLQMNGGIEAPEVDIRSYAKYVLKEGTREEKRGVLACLQTKLFLLNQRVSLESMGDRP